MTTAVVFTVLAVNLNAQLTQAYAARDPNHTMPPSAYADLHALDAQRERFQDLAIGFYVGTGVMAAAATVLWLLPHGPQRPVAQPTVAFDVAPGAANLTVRF